MAWGSCRDRAPPWAQQSPNSSWACSCHSSVFVDAIAMQRMLWAIFSFGGCGKTNLEALFLPRQTNFQVRKRSNWSRTWNEEPWSEMDLCNRGLNEAPGCQFSSPFVFSSSVLLDTPALCPFPEDFPSGCAQSRAVPRGMGEVTPCHFVCCLAELICCSCACRELASCEGIYHWRYADSKPSKKSWASSQCALCL